MSDWLTCILAFPPDSLTLYQSSTIKPIMSCVVYHRYIAASWDFILLYQHSLEKTWFCVFMLVLCLKWWITAFGFYPLDTCRMSSKLKCHWFPPPPSCLWTSTPPLLFFPQVNVTIKVNVAIFVEVNVTEDLLQLSFLQFLPQQRLHGLLELIRWYLSISIKVKLALETTMCIHYVILYYIMTKLIMLLGCLFFRKKCIFKRVCKEFVSASVDVVTCYSFTVWVFTF